ncbi:hypothetical protein V2W45_1474934 [Cenococcum geophilum]
MLLVTYTYTRRAKERFLLINKEQLRFNPTILILDGKRYIKVRAPYIATHRKGDTFRIPLVIKDLWQYLERKEEGKLLHKAIEKEVVNIARYYHYETIHGLDIISATNYKLESLIMPLKPGRVQISIRKGQSSNRKRSSSYTKLPPSKRTYSGSPKHPIKQNRVHRRPSFLINLNLAIKEQWEGALGARGKTGIRAFIAIEVLLGKKYSAWHNFKSVTNKGDFLKTAEDNFSLYYQPLIP